MGVNAVSGATAPTPGLIDLFLDWAGRMPHAPALIDGDLVISFGALEIASRRAAANFAAAGWRPGDVVGGAFGVMPFGLALAAILGLARAGITQLPLTAHEAAGEEAATLLRRFGAVGLLAPRPPATGPAVPLRLPDAAWLASDAPPPAAFAGPVLTGLRFAIGRSSGTTGAQKAFAVTHAQEAARRVLNEAPLRPDDRLALLASLGFLTSVSYALRGLACGVTLIAMPQLPEPEAILQRIDRCGVTYVVASPVHLRLLLGAVSGAAPRLPRLRVLRVGGAALAPSLLAEARARLSPAIYCTYGTNEAGGLLCATPEMLARDPGTIGRIHPGIALELRDAEGKPLPPGRPGRLWVRTAGLIDGYLAASAAEAARFRDGWFDTGDVAEIDAGGFVFLKGRADELMNYDGMLVAPREIEAAFERHPLVAEVVAFALPSEVHQDVPCIAVVARGPCDAAPLLAHGRERLGPKAPWRVFWVTTMPRNAAGKVMRRELAALAASARMR